jgi:phage head maturation protease
MTKLLAPKGWKPGQVARRFSSTSPSSFDARARTVDAVLSTGSAVQRFYGIEKLRIDTKSVDTSRVHNGGVLLLDSHRQDAGIASAFGKVQETWIERGALWGKLKFNETPAGKLAAGMIERGEAGAISCGYRVDTWEITDKAGDIVDQQDVGWSDDDLIFTGTRWTLLEASLVCVAADSLASVRSMIDLSQRPDLEPIAARMRMRQRAHDLAQRSHVVLQ